MNPWALKPSDLYSELMTGEKGLSQKEAEERLKTDGLNEISRKERKPWFLILLEQFTNPLVIVLLAATAIAFFLGETTDAYIIISIVLINAAIGFVQEFRAEKTVRALRKLITNEAIVLRNGKKVEIDSKLLVKGDIVYLSIGDIVPADIRLVKLEELTINEAAFTGESAPAVKTTGVIPDKTTLAQDLKNMAFMGTHVLSGEGFGIVTATGSSTELGKTAKYLKEPETVSDFEKSVSNFSTFLLKVIMIMTFFIFVANALLGHGILSSFLFALALAVGITPEALPIVITVSLSHGAQIMARHKVVVKKLASIEDLGNMDILCTDKTGTLTEGKLTLENFINTDNQIDRELLIFGMLCNDAVIGGKKIEGNIIDRAIWESVESGKVMKDYRHHEILDHNEFDFERRRMSVVAKTPDGRRLLIVKGAFESIREVSTMIKIDGQHIPLDEKSIKAYKETVDSYRRDGYTTISIAAKDWHKDDSAKEDENGLTLMGFLIFMDPPRKSAKSSIRTLQDLNVSIKVLSGDDPLVTEMICKKVGLKINGNRIYTGDELDKLDEKQFARVVEKYNVFSRIAPAHKYRIVNTLNTGPERTVAFLGDGINDAPAIKAADVGISVNNATDIAKEAADIILLQKNLKVITDGIIEGRKIFTNITKYILNTVSANYGNMFTVAASSLFLKFIPLLPSQILLNNLITDTPMMAVATDRVDPDQLKRPRKLDVKMIRTFMSFFGILSTIFDMTTILAMLFIFKADTQLFRTAWFFESALSEVVVTFAIRTKKSFWKSRPGTLLTVISGLIVAVLFLLVFTPAGNIFEFTVLPAPVLLFCCLIVIAYFATAEISKRWFAKRFEF
jgi:Mg2+-importing ATPase